MKSPKKILTGINRASSIVDNQINNESFEALLEENFNKANLFEENKRFVNDFLGDADESTEISSLINNLNISSSNSENNTKIQENFDSSKNEILEILKNKRKPNTFSISSSRNKILCGRENFESFIIKPKKISMQGRVLKDLDQSSGASIQNSDIPERSSNPIFKNHAFQNKILNNAASHFKKIKILTSSW